MIYVLATPLFKDTKLKRAKTSERKFTTATRPFSDLADSPKIKTGRKRIKWLINAIGTKSLTQYAWVLFAHIAASRAREKPPRLHAQRQGRPNKSLRRGLALPLRLPVPAAAGLE